MSTDPKPRSSSLLGRIVADLLRPTRRRADTDVDFRPPPGPGPDVIGGWERRPHVSGAQGDDVR
jgi:hypothetical protein